MNYSFWQRLKVKLSGRCFLRYDLKPGWSGYLPAYLARCPIHGYYEGHPQGYFNKLNCPTCLEAIISSREETANDLAKAERV